MVIYIILIKISNLQYPKITHQIEKNIKKKEKKEKMLEF